MSDRPAVRVFRPRPSVWAFIVSIILIAGVLVIFSSVSGGDEVSIVLRAVLLAFAAAVLFFTGIYATMRYELRENHLRLVCGPFRWLIKYGDIAEIRKTNLKYHPTSTGWKLPGYALFNIYYGDRGYVTMCATRVCRGILLIKTDNRLYGVSPQNEDAFISQLKETLTSTSTSGHL